MGETGDVELIQRKGSLALMATSRDSVADQESLALFGQAVDLDGGPKTPGAPVVVELETSLKGPTLNSLAETPESTSSITLDEEGAWLLRDLRKTQLTSDGRTELFVGVIGRRGDDVEEFLVRTDPWQIPVIIIFAGYCLLKHMHYSKTRLREMTAIMDSGLRPVPVLRGSAAGEVNAKGLFARLSCRVEYSFDVYTMSGEFVRRDHLDDLPDHL